MNNQQQGSYTHRVRQNAPVFPASATIDTPFTPKGATSATHFLEMGRAAQRGEALDARRAQPQPSKHFQQTRRPVAAPSTHLMLTPDGGDDQVQLAVLPELVQETRRRLAQQAQDNRETRRARDRANLFQLLHAPTDEAAPDFVVPASLQEARQPPSGSVQVTLTRPVVPGPAWGDLSADAVLDGAPWVSQGSREVFKVLHFLAVGTCEERRYPMIPSTSAFHLPQLLLAVVVKYTPRHVRRLANELEKAGLINFGAHAANVRTHSGKYRHMWDGTIWAVKLRPSNCNAYLAPDDWKHEWRDFDADLQAGRTAEKLMSYLNTFKDLDRQFHLLKQWAVNPNSKFTSLSLERTFQADQKKSIQDTVYSLPLLGELSGPRLAKAIGEAAHTIAHALRDGHSHRHWCGLLWAATRNHSLEGFAAQLLRLFADVGESAELRNPGALFTARLHST